MCDFLLEKVNVHVFFKQKDKVYDSQVRIWLSLKYYYKGGFACFSAMRVHV